MFQMWVSSDRLCWHTWTPLVRVKLPSGYYTGDNVCVIFNGLSQWWEFPDYHSSAEQEQADPLNKDKDVQIQTYFKHEPSQK